MQGKAMSATDVMRMRTLREEGLSNRKIALELGVSYETVHRHLGRQPDGVRSNYGEIVSHPIGECFIDASAYGRFPLPDNALTPLKELKTKMADDKKKPAFKLKTLKIEGAKYGYLFSMGDNIQIVNERGESFMVDKEDVLTFCKEITWLAECLSQDKLPL